MSGGTLGAVRAAGSRQEATLDPATAARGNRRELTGHVSRPKTDEVGTPFREGPPDASLLSMNNHQEGTMPTATHPFERASADHSRVADSQPREIRLMVVDDHPAVRLGLVQLLAGQLDFDVELVCIDAEGAVAQAELAHIDVAIVDYHLGGRNGLWVCRRLKQLAESPRVIVFSAFANDHLAACCVVAGADGVLNKGVLGSELCDAVRSVARGRRVMPKASRPMSDMLRRRLEDIEQAIFGMLMAGIPRSEISQTLRMSARELSSREGAMLRKLEVLPGEASAPSRSRGRIDIERLDPQEFPSAPARP
jgi:DNA-binding NarL/FixJ family response regulator